MGVGTLVVLLCAAAVAMESRSYTASRESLRWFKESQTLVLIGVGLIPLFFGIGAGRADRRDGAFRLLANSGVSPISHWLTKHAVWLGLAMGTAGWFLALDRLLDSNSFWETAQSAANATFYRGFPFGAWAPPEQAGFAVTLAIILFDILLQYALGHLLSSTIPSAMTSLVLGLIGCLALRDAVGDGDGNGNRHSLLVDGRSLPADLSPDRLGANPRLASRSKFARCLEPRCRWLGASVAWHLLQRSQFFESSRFLRPRCRSSFKVRSAPRPKWSP